MQPGGGGLTEADSGWPMGLELAKSRWLIRLRLR